MRAAYWIASLAIVMALGLTVASAQEVYRPVGMKAGGGTPNLFCITGQQVDLVSKFFGFTWVRDITTMTLINGSEKIELTFNGDCVESAKVVR